MPALQDCPIESLSSLSSSFIELAVSTTAGAAVSETPNEKAEDVMIDPMMAAVINDVLGALGGLLVFPGSQFVSRSHLRSCMHLADASCCCRPSPRPRPHKRVCGADSSSRGHCSAGRGTDACSPAAAASAELNGRPVSPIAAEQPRAAAFIQLSLLLLLLLMQAAAGGRRSDGSAEQLGGRRRRSGRSDI